MVPIKQSFNENMFNTCVIQAIHNTNVFNQLNKIFTIFNWGEFTHISDLNVAWLNELADTYDNHNPVLYLALC